MHAHSVEKHNGEKVNFKVKVLGVCSGDALLRQCMEAVVIRDTKPTMNGREEGGTTNNSMQQRTKQSITLNKKRQIATSNKNDDIAVLG